jgi:hypothetical protein
LGFESLPRSLAESPQTAGFSFSGAATPVLEKALELGTLIIALTVPDRKQIIRALDDPWTTALAELQATLLLEHEWRVREGLV